MKALEEKNVWIYEEDYPSTLSPEEILDPMQVVFEFFERHELQQSKSYLWQCTIYCFTDQIKPSPEFRLILYHFGKQLEKMLDAAWVISNQMNSNAFKPMSAAYNTIIKQWLDMDFISFLTLPQTKNPRKVLQSFFQFSSLSRWKQSWLLDLEQVLLDSQFYLICNSFYLKEFSDFHRLTSLLEALYLLQLSQRPILWNITNIKELNWSYGNNEESSYLWGKNYFSNHRLYDAHQSFAYLCYASRFNHEWHSAAGYKLLKNYGTVHRILHLGYELSIREDVHVSIRKELKNHFKKWPLGKSTRFLTRLILGSPTFRSAYNYYIEPKKEIDRITAFISLINQHYKTIN